MELWEFLIEDTYVRPEKDKERRAKLDTGLSKAGKPPIKQPTE